MADLLIPIAISSQLDITGEERVHAAKYNTTERAVFVPPPPAVWVGEGTILNLHKSVDGGLTFDPTANTGVINTSSNCLLRAGDRLYHWSYGEFTVTSVGGSTWVPTTGLQSIGAQASDALKTPTEYLLFGASIDGSFFASANGVDFVARTMGGRTFGSPVQKGATTLVISNSVSGGLAISTDATNFTSYAIAGFNASDSLQRLIATQAGYMVFGRDTGGSLKIMKSLTGLSGSWTALTAPTTAPCFGAIQADNGRIVMVTLSGFTATAWYTDDDGSNWSNGGTFSYGSPDGYNAVSTRLALLATVENRFYFFAKQGGGNNLVYRSADGTGGWTSVYNAVAHQPGGIVGYP